MSGFETLVGFELVRTPRTVFGTLMHSGFSTENERHSLMMPQPETNNPEKEREQLGAKS